MKSSRLLQNFRVFDVQNPTRGVNLAAGDATEAILSARERYPALARAAEVKAVAS